MERSRSLAPHTCGTQSCGKKSISNSALDWSFYEDLFRAAAEKEVTILPDLGGNLAEPGKGY